MWIAQHGCARPRVAAAFAALAILSVCGCSLLSPDLPPPSQTPALAASLELLHTDTVDARLQTLTFSTPALDGPTHVDVLLPAGYDAQSPRRYPVVYLLQGAIDDYSAWVVEGNVEAVSANFPVILVMPDAGNEGYYTDAYNGGAGGPPMWETYHIDQLIPWIDAHYRTVATRGGRGVAGVSMGGFGALSYAARHPDLFVTAASFSGLIDTDSAPARISIPDSVFGRPAADDVRWRGHNPLELAPNLRGVTTMLYTRNGWPTRSWRHFDPAEIIVHMQNWQVHQHMLDLGIPHQWHDIGPGFHKWPIWDDDLRDALARMLEVFADVPAPPSPLTHTAVESDYAVFGWHVTLNRPQLEFSTLADADAHGFRLSGSGSASVTTPPLYPPRAEFAVTLQADSGSRQLRLRAGDDGRLTVPLTLGPVNASSHNAWADEADDPDNAHIHTVTVRIGAVGA